MSKKEGFSKTIDKGRIVVKIIELESIDIVRVISDEPVITDT